MWKLQVIVWFVLCSRACCGRTPRTNENLYRGYYGSFPNNYPGQIIEGSASVPALSYQPNTRIYQSNPTLIGHRTLGRISQAAIPAHYSDFRTSWTAPSTATISHGYRSSPAAIVNHGYRSSPTATVNHGYRSSPTATVNQGYRSTAGQWAHLFGSTMSPSTHQDYVRAHARWVQEHDQLKDVHDSYINTGSPPQDSHQFGTTYPTTTYRHYPTTWYNDADVGGQPDQSTSNVDNAASFDLRSSPNHQRPTRTSDNVESNVDNETIHPWAMDEDRNSFQTVYQHRVPGGHAKRLRSTNVPNKITTSEKIRNTRVAKSTFNQASDINQGSSFHQAANINQGTIANQEYSNSQTSNVGQASSIEGSHVNQEANVDLRYSSINHGTTTNSHQSSNVDQATHMNQDSAAAKVYMAAEHYIGKREGNVVLDSNGNIVDKNITAPEASYSYEYSVQAPLSEDFKIVRETRNGENTIGAYSFVQPDGCTRMVRYRAGPKGYRSTVDYRGPGCKEKYAGY